MAERLIFPLELDNSAALRTINQTYNAANRRFGSLKLDFGALDKAGAPLGRITGDFDKFRESIEASNARVLAFGASAGAIFAVSQAFRTLISDAINVEKELANIQVILNATTRDFSDFSASLFRVASQTGQSFEVAAEAAAEFARQGLGLTKTLQNTEAALVLTRITGLQAAESVKAITAALNTFGSEISSAEDLVNVFANVDTAFAVSAEDLANGFRRVGSTAADAGVEVNQLAAIVTALQQTTARGGNVIGNGLKTIFTRLQRTRVQDFLNEVGVATTNANGSFRSAIDVLRGLAGEFDNLTDAQKAQAAELTAGVFQINTVRALFKDLGDGASVYTRALEVANSTQNEAFDRSIQLNETLAAKINATRNSIKEFNAALLDSGALSGVKGLVDSVGDSFDGLTGLLTNLFNEEADNFNSIGSKIGRGLIQGIGDAITGPGLAVLARVVGQIFGNLGRDVFKGGGSAFFGSGDRSLGEATEKNEKERLSLIEQIQNQEREINAILQQNNAEVLEQIKNTSSVSKQQEIILKVIQQQNAALEKQAAIVRSIASGSTGGRTQRATATPRRAAGGFIPSLLSEEMAIARGVGGARNTARAVPRNIKTSRDKSERVTVNTDEVIVRDYLGSGADAVFNRDMIRSAGGIKGVRNLGNVENIFAGGLLPERQALGSGIIPRETPNLASPAGLKASASLQSSFFAKAAKDPNAIQKLILDDFDRFQKIAQNFRSRVNRVGGDDNLIGLTLDDFLAQTGGSVQNLAPITRNSTGGLSSFNRGRSALLFEEDKRKIIIDQLDSFKKGDAFRLFNEVVKVSRSSGKPIVSETQLPQASRLSDGPRSFTGNSAFDSLLTIFPQLRYRSQSGLQTSGLFSFGNDQFAFKSIRELRNQLSGKPADYINRNNAGQVDLFDLTTTPTSGRGDALASGFVPHLTPLQDAISREVLALTERGFDRLDAQRSIRVGQSPRLKSQGNPFGFGVFNKLQGQTSIGKALRDHVGENPRRIGLAGGSVPNLVDTPESRFIDDLLSRRAEASSSGNVRDLERVNEQLRGEVSKLTKQLGQNNRTVSDQTRNIKAAQRIAFEAPEVATEELRQGALKRSAQLIQDAPDEATEQSRRKRFGPAREILRGRDQFEQPRATFGIGEANVKELEKAQVKLDSQNLQRDLETGVGKALKVSPLNPKTSELNFGEALRQDAEQAAQRRRSPREREERTNEANARRNARQQARTTRVQEEIAQRQDRANNLFKKFVDNAVDKGTDLSKERVDQVAREITRRTGGVVTGADREAAIGRGATALRDRRLAAERKLDARARDGFLSVGQFRKGISELRDRDNLGDDFRANTRRERFVDRARQIGEDRRRNPLRRGLNKLTAALLDPRGRVNVTDDQRRLSRTERGIRAQRNQVFTNRTQSLAFLAPLLAQPISELTGNERIGEGVTGIATGAAFGSIFGPIGAGVGLATAGILEWGKALKESQIGIKEVSATYNAVKAENEQLINSLANFTAAASKLDSLVLDPNANPRQIETLVREQANALSGIEDEDILRRALQAPDNESRQRLLLDEQERVRSQNTALQGLTSIFQELNEGTSLIEAFRGISDLDLEAGQAEAIARQLTLTLNEAIGDLTPEQSRSLTTGDLPSQLNALQDAGVIQGEANKELIDKLSNLELSGTTELSRAITDQVVRIKENSASLRFFALRQQEQVFAARNLTKAVSAINIGSQLEEAIRNARVNVATSQAENALALTNNRRPELNLQVSFEKALAKSNLNFINTTQRLNQSLLQQISSLAASTRGSESFAQISDFISSQGAAGATFQATVAELQKVIPNLEGIVGGREVAAEIEKLRALAVQADIQRREANAIAVQQLTTQRQLLQTQKFEELIDAVNGGITGEEIGKVLGDINTFRNVFASPEGTAEQREEQLEALLTRGPQGEADVLLSQIELNRAISTEVIEAIRKLETIFPNNPLLIDRRVRAEERIAQTLPTETLQGIFNNFNRDGLNFDSSRNAFDRFQREADEITRLRIRGTRNQEGGISQEEANVRIERLRAEILREAQRNSQSRSKFARNDSQRFRDLQRDLGLAPQAGAAPLARPEFIEDLNQLLLRLTSGAQNLRQQAGVERGKNQAQNASRLDASADALDQAALDLARVSQFRAGQDPQEFDKELLRILTSLKEAGLGTRDPRTGEITPITDETIKNFLNRLSTDEGVVTDPAERAELRKRQALDEGNPVVQALKGIREAFSDPNINGLSALGVKIDESNGILNNILTANRDFLLTIKNTQRAELGRGNLNEAERDINVTGDAIKVEFNKLERERREFEAGNVPEILNPRTIGLDPNLNFENRPTRKLAKGFGFEDIDSLDDLNASEIADLFRAGTINIIEKTLNDPRRLRQQPDVVKEQVPLFKELSNTLQTGDLERSNEILRDLSKQGFDFGRFTDAEGRDVEIGIKASDIIRLLENQLDLEAAGLPIQNFDASDGRVDRGDFFAPNRDEVFQFNRRGLERITQRIEQLTNARETLNDFAKTIAEAGNNLQNAINNTATAVTPEQEQAAQERFNESIKSNDELRQTIQNFTERVIQLLEVSREESEEDESTTNVNVDGQVGVAITGLENFPSDLQREIQQTLDEKLRNFFDNPNRNGFFGNPNQGLA